MAHCWTNVYVGIHLIHTMPHFLRDNSDAANPVRAATIAV